jgi:hypothetical protein
VGTQPSPKRPGIERRLRYLRNWELANVALIPGLIMVMWWVTDDPARAWTRRAVGVAAVSYLLFQGGLYWHLKLQALRAERRALPAWFSTVFRAFHRTNPPMLAAVTLWLVAGATASARDHAEDVAWSLALLTFAALEHVNYFVRQLMHDTPADLAYWQRYRRLRRPPLRRDLDATRTRPHATAARHSVTHRP